MKNFLIRIGLHLGTSAVAIIVAALVLAGFRLNFSGFITAVVVFTVAQALLTTAVAALARKHAPALTGASSLISTFLALVIANMFGGGTSIHGFFTWILATVIVWAIAAAGGVFLPKLVGSKGVAKAG